jgi:ABC-type amino acid transport substrate-binding protein
MLWPVNFDSSGKQIPNSEEINTLVSYFEREANLKFIIINLPWKRAQLEALKGDGLLYGFSKSSERLAQYRFSDTVNTLHIWGISYPEYNSRFSQLSDLKGKVVAAGAGINHGLEYEKARNNVFTVQEDFVSDRYRFRKLIEKQSDLLLLPFNQKRQRAELEQYINEVVVPAFNDPKLKGRNFEFSTHPIFYESVHFATGKGYNKEVLDRIDKAIQAGTKDGSLAKLFK